MPGQIQTARGSSETISAKTYLHLQQFAWSFYGAWPPAAWSAQ